MNLRVWGIISVLVTSTVAFSQTTQPVAGTVSGAVIGTNVYVRSGPGEPGGQSNYYACAKVSAPTQVIIYGQKDGWLEIAPVAGCYSVIAVEYVQLSADGRTGTVSGDDVRVRAGGDLHQENFWQPQAQVASGTAVQIISAEPITDAYHKWYKITPPAGAHYWIYSQFVKTNGEPPPAQLTQLSARSGAAVAAVASGKTPTTMPSRAVTTRPAGPAMSNVEDQLMAKIKAFEADLNSEYAKPADQRDYDRLIKSLDAMNISQDSFAYDWKESRKAFLQQAIDQRGELTEIDRLLKDSAARQAAGKLERDRVVKTVEIAQQQNRFAAEGVLVPSAVFTGGSGLTKRYVLREPDSRKIVAYVTDDDNSAGLDACVGKAVGIQGARRYDRDLEVPVVEAVSVVVQDEQPGIPAPPTPRVKPMPVEPAAAAQPAPAAPEAAASPLAAPAEENAPSAPADAAAPAAPFDPAKEGLATAPADEGGTVPTSQPASSSPDFDVQEVQPVAP